MGTRYLTEMADALRSAGLSVTEVDGWQTRARSSGGYDGEPTAIMNHHTASNLSALRDVQMMTFELVYAPIANLYFARDGVVWVMAGGATNTNGAGGPLGHVPANGMNRAAIGLEIGNTGIGEPYPTVQQDAVLLANQVLARTYNIPSSAVWAHFEWSPGRKIDPFGPSRWNDHRNDYWDMDRFRADVESGIQPPPTPTPPPGDDDAMLVNLVREKNGPFWFQQWSNGTKTWIADPATMTLIQELNPGIGTITLPNDAWMNATGVVVGPQPPGTDGWGKRV